MGGTYWCSWFCFKNISPWQATIHFLWSIGHHQNCGKFVLDAIKKKSTKTMVCALIDNQLVSTVNLTRSRLHRPRNEIIVGLQTDMLLGKRETLWWNNGSWKNLSGEMVLKFRPIVKEIFANMPKRNDGVYLMYILQRNQNFSVH